MTGFLINLLKIISGWIDLKFYKKIKNKLNSEFNEDPLNPLQLLFLYVELYSVIRIFLSFFYYFYLGLIIYEYGFFATYYSNGIISYWISSPNKVSVWEYGIHILRVALLSLKLRYTVIGFFLHITHILLNELLWLKVLDYLLVNDFLGPIMSSLSVQRKGSMPFSLPKSTKRLVPFIESSVEDLKAVEEEEEPNPSTGYKKDLV